MRVKASGDPALQAFDQRPCSVGDGEAESNEESTIKIKHSECLHISSQEKVNKLVLKNALQLLG